jgi:hypothetical protein
MNPNAIRMAVKTPAKTARLKLPFIYLNGLHFVMKFTYGEALSVSVQKP